MPYRFTVTVTVHDGPEIPEASQDIICDRSFVQIVGRFRVGTMLSQKRKHSALLKNDSHSKASDYSLGPLSADEVDISSILTGKKARTSLGEDSDDDNFNDFIQISMAKRAVKKGTEIVKKSKGKTKITKGEVGGGSFQSMGMSRDAFFFKKKLS